MVQYKLYDFDARGLAEPLRLMFSYSGTPFEDIRVPCKGLESTLPKEIKERCTWGEVPFLEVDGRPLAQSLSIGRFLATRFGLRGSDDYEAALTDEYVDTVHEMWTSPAWTPIYFINRVKEPEKFMAKLNEINNDKFKSKYMKKFCEILRNNGGKFLVGKSISWADIYLAAGLNDVDLLWGLDYFQEFPELKPLYDNVMMSPGIAKWVKERPVTQY